MNVHLLIDEIVRQTTVLIAQLSTAAGSRAPLSHLADQVFVEVARELDAQGVGRKVAADMFGMALRSYQTKLRRLNDNDKAGPSLWQRIYADLSAGSATRGELERRHKSHSPKQVAATLRDMVQSGLAYRAGRERDALFGLTSDADRQRLSASENLRLQRDLCAYLVASGSASTLADLQEQLHLEPVNVLELVESLIAEGRLFLHGSTLSARRFEVGVGHEQGWETAVLDHFRAVTTSLAAKVNRPVAASDDKVGGGTRSFLVHAEHPHREEVYALLRDTRQRLTELWQKVAAHNEARPPSPDAERVTFYFGQNVICGAGVEGASRTAGHEQAAHEQLGSEEQE